jgi:hypothetical protein
MERVVLTNATSSAEPAAPCGLSAVDYGVGEAVDSAFQRAASDGAAPAYSEQHRKDDHPTIDSHSVAVVQWRVQVHDDSGVEGEGHAARGSQRSQEAPGGPGEHGVPRGGTGLMGKQQHEAE